MDLALRNAPIGPKARARSWFITFLFFVIVGRPVVGMANVVFSNETKKDNDSPWWEPTPQVSPVECGVAALYAMLKLRGREITYQEVRTLMRVDPVYGSTLADVVSASHALGTHVSPAKCDTPAWLDQIPLPAIAHLGLGPMSGHYVVLIAVDQERVAMIDAADQDVRQMERGRFERLWTGYLLVGQRPWKQTGLQYGTALSSSFLAAAILWFVTGRITPSRRVIATSLMTLIASVSCAYLVHSSVNLSSFCTVKDRSSHHNCGAETSLGFRDLPIIVPAPAVSAVPEPTPRDREDLRHLLTLCQPYFKKHSVSLDLHQLRLWGTASRWPTQPSTRWPEGNFALSGEEILGYLLNANSENVGLGEESPRLLFRTAWGLAFKGAGVGRERGVDRMGEQAHVDQLLSTLAEVGLATHYPVYVDDHKGSVGELLSDAVARFSIKDELEFSAIAFASYMEAQTWTNRFGQRFTFDEIADELTARFQKPIGLACYGTHVPNSLVVLLASDEQRPILSAQARQRIELFLKDLSKKLETTQDVRGLWWPDHSGYTWSRDHVGDPDDWAAVRVTGHTLEWISRAPPELRPSQDVVLSAIRGLQERVQEIAEDVTAPFFNFNTLSHCARGVVLSYGYRDASEAYDELGMRD